MEEMRDRFIWVREQLGWTSAELARRLGVKRQSVYSVEQGSTKGLSAENLFVWQDVTGYSAHWLVTGKGEPRERRDREVDWIVARIQSLSPELKQKLLQDLDFLARLQDSNQPGG